MTLFSFAHSHTLAEITKIANGRGKETKESLNEIASELQDGYGDCKLR